MGADLGELIIKNNITLTQLSGKVIAVDAFNVLYQFLASIRQEDGTPLMDGHGKITAHLSGLFYRTAKLLENGVKPVYVFDGEPIKLKEKTRAERTAAKTAAMEKWKKALEEERLEDAKKYAQATSRLTTEMVNESKALLDALGVPWLQAPGEGEAQATEMVKQGLAYAVASQDYDVLLFGAPRLVRNLSIIGKRKIPRQNRFIMVEPEEIILEEVLKNLGINQMQLITIGILIGTDFNSGVKGIGPKTALKIVKQHKTFDEAIRYVVQKYGYSFEVELDEVVKIFTEPKCEKNLEVPKWGDVDENAVENILVKQHDFSPERVAAVTRNIKEKMREVTGQRRLENWF